MKQLIKSRLPKEWQDRIGGDRFAVADVKDPFDLRLFASGNDPAALAEKFPQHQLYRVDEAKRVAG